MRISVTDRCNFACLFCMPDKDITSWIPQQEILTFDEIITITKVLTSLGIEKIRITGGEPLLRKDLTSLITRLRSLDGVHSIDMTTNGWELDRMAGALYRSGLRGVTVSLHSLHRDRFAKISGMDALPRVLRGIDRALAEGLGPVKINSVAIKDYNDDEILDLVDYARERNVPLRFIEFMPLDGLGIWRPDKVVSGKEIREIIARKYPLLPDGRGVSETSSLWRFEDGRGEIGLITPITEPFCDDCDRVRLTADGRLLSCLFDTEFHDLRSMIRSGLSQEELSKFVLRAVWEKPDGVGYMPWVKDGWERPRSMNAIGG